MHAPTATDALGVWERGQSQSHAERGLALLALVHVATPFDALADISIGARDSTLLALREAMFGTRLDSCANCPACGETMELDFSTRALTAPSGMNGTIALHLSGYDLTLRPITSRDLLALAHDDEADDPRRALLGRCLLAGHHGDRATTAHALPAAVVDAAAQALSEADPQADINLSIACANCGHAWQAPFDILSYLWTELDAWARRMLRDVHMLARAYGWREADILALSPLRRKFYLEMAAS